MEHVRELLNSFAWKMSKTVAILAYCWLVLGFVWAMNCRSCYPRCPWLKAATASALGLSVVRVLAALVALRCMISNEVRRQARLAPQQVGATEEQIAALPLVGFANGGPGHSSCAICLSEYAEGDELRQLPCMHLFCHKCADPWLAKSKRCPLCMQAIDEPRQPPSGQWPCARRKQVGI